MDPENGDIPASYVSLPKGVSFCGMNGHQVMFFSETNMYIMSLKLATTQWS